MRNILVTLALLLAHSASAARPDYVAWLAEPDSPTYTYSLRDTATVRVRILTGGTPANRLQVSYTVYDDMMTATTVDKNVVEVVDGNAMITVPTPSIPSFRVVDIAFNVGGEKYQQQLKLGYATDEITTYTEMPKDFRRFWQKQVAEARKTPLNPVLTPIEEHTNDSISVFKLRLETSKGRCIYGFLSMPRDNEKHPVVFCPPGAGVKIDAYDSQYTRDGYIFLSIEIHGIDPDLPPTVRDSLRVALKDYMSMGIESREGYYYHDVYVACVRAVDYLCSLEAFDGRNVVVTGGSQGGALSIVTAALHERVSMLGVFYPALSDLDAYRHGRAGGWPHFFTSHYVGRSTPVSEDAARLTLPYYDVVNFARLVSADGFYSYGHNDNVVPPSSVMAVLGVIGGEKEVLVTPSSAHWRFASSQARWREYMRERIR